MLPGVCTKTHIHIVYSGHFFQLDHENEVGKLDGGGRVSVHLFRGGVRWMSDGDGGGVCAGAAEGGGGDVAGQKGRGTHRWVDRERRGAADAWTDPDCWAALSRAPADKGRGGSHCEVHLLMP